MPTELLQNPAFPRAVVLGLFGGVGLALTTIYSRRGPLIYPVYAAVLAALTLLLARYNELPFNARLVAALGGFCAASAVAYVTVGVRARTGLADLAVSHRTSLFGHAWRWAFLLAVGTVASAGVAFIAG